MRCCGNQFSVPDDVTADLLAEVAKLSPDAQARLAAEIAEIVARVTGGTEVVR